MVIALGLRGVAASSMLLILRNDDNEGAAGCIMYDLGCTLCHSFPIGYNRTNCDGYRAAVL